MRREQQIFEKAHGVGSECSGADLIIWAVNGVVAKDSPLCQSYRTGDHGTEVRMPDKIAAAQLMVKMCGWANPERVELSATDTLAEFIQSIRYSQDQSSGRQRRSQLTQDWTRALEEVLPKQH